MHKPRPIACRSTRSLAVCLALVSANASATIVDHGTYFTDTNTGLDWLNNQPLAGQSYNSVLSGYGGYTTSGWHFATGDQLLALVGAYVGPVPTLDSSNSWTAYNFDAQAFANAYSLIEDLGINVSFGAPPDARSTRAVYNTELTGIATQGWYDDGDGGGNAGIFDFAAYSYPSFSLTPYSMTQVIPNFLSPDDFHGPNVSAILVREGMVPAVPEPPVYAMTIVGLIGVALASRRKKRMARATSGSLARG